ncbi:methyltransferase [Aquisphaera insulae]|uniref:methyltransferase n=1 Tax=Aquisphaera insulae TaxID=2712864 RepID=UPI0013ECBEB0|nr:methyltransferase [Aquisphaera insulae]
MTPLSREVPLALDRPDLASGVREVLGRVGYDEKHIYERLGVDGEGKLSFGPLDRPRLLWRTREPDPLGTLMRLFLMEVPVTSEDFRRAVAPMDPAEWAELGLVANQGDEVRPLVAMRASRTLIMAHDRSWPEGGKQHDYVLGVTGSTLSLAEITVRPRVGRMLDLGTGSGFQALSAAAHSGHAVGTDRNARAVGFARFNAILNGIGNVEFRTGDLFQPVAGERFDLIVTNPPFVISPENQLQYRDSGLRGDAICERIVREAPVQLAEGGIFELIGNWVRDKGDEWRGRLLDWFDGSGCDALVYQNATHPIDVYASHWLRQGDVGDEEGMSEAFGRWMDHYREIGVEAIDTGLIVLRRRSGGNNWVHFETEKKKNQPNGPGILATFAARDWLDRMGGTPGAMMDLRLRSRPELRIVQRLEPGPSGWVVEDAHCVIGKDLEYEGRMDQSVFILLTLCRGTLPLSQVLSQVAAKAGRDLESIVPEMLVTVHRLISQGFLLPAEEVSNEPA